MEAKIAAFFVSVIILFLWISTDIRENSKEQLTHLAGSQVDTHAAICFSSSALRMSVVTTKFLRVCHSVYGDFATCEVWSQCIASLWLWHVDRFPGVGYQPSVN